MKATFWMTAAETERELILRDEVAAKVYGASVLQRAFNHLLFDSVDDRPLKSEFIVFAEAMGRIGLRDDKRRFPVKTMKEKLEQSQPCWNREVSVAQKIENRKRERRNRNNRERYQAMRDLGLVKTPYGWE